MLRRASGAKPPGVKIDIVSIFPAMVQGPLSEGIVGRAAGRGVLDIRVHDLRDHTTDRHRVVDDVPFGGGPGMVLKPEPLFRAVESISAPRRPPSAGIQTTPPGRPSPPASMNTSANRREAKSRIASYALDHL